MGELQVSAWKRYGQDRLYVNDAAGETVAWFDRKSGQIEITVEPLRAAALQALAPYLVRPPAPAPTPARARAGDAPAPPMTAPPGLPPLPPEFDLALNPPGLALQNKLTELSLSPFVRAVAWLLRWRTESDSWRDGLAGERIVAAELQRLTSHGWRVLHSVPLPRDVDIDHLLIGPGGVFSINTKNHRGKAVWVGNDMVKVNHGDAHPYVRKSRHEAARAAKVLARSCGFPVPVQPTLVFVKPTHLKVEPSLLDVRVLHDRQLAALRRQTGALRTDQIAAVYAAARDRRVWATA